MTPAETRLNSTMAIPDLTKLKEQHRSLLDPSHAAMEAFASWGSGRGPGTGLLPLDRLAWRRDSPLPWAPCYMKKTPTSIKGNLRTTRHASQERSQHAADRSMQQRSTGMWRTSSHCTPPGRARRRSVPAGSATTAPESAAAVSVHWLVDEPQQDAGCYRAAPGNRHAATDKPTSKLTAALAAWNKLHRGRTALLRRN
jgi:hypothetical protein